MFSPLHRTLGLSDAEHTSFKFATPFLPESADVLD